MIRLFTISVLALPERSSISMESDKTSLAESLERAVFLLSKNAWIYDFKLTRFFLDRVWESVPEEWSPVLWTMTTEQLSEIPFGGCQPHWPASLNQFIRDCVSLALARNLHHNANQGSTKLNLQATVSAGSSSKPSIDHTPPLKSTDIDVEIRKGMSEKKLHEVCHMTSLIDHVTRKSGCDAIVDVGSGLGYLGQVLHTKFGHPVLGLEGKQSHTTGAEKRALQDSMCSHLHNSTCELHPTEESNQELLSLIRDWFNNLLQDGSNCCHQTGSSRNAPASPFLCPSYETPESVCEMGHRATCYSSAIETNLRTCNSEVKDTNTKMGNTGSHEFESSCSKCQRCNSLKVSETVASNTRRSNNKTLENKCVNSTNKTYGDNQTYIDPLESSSSQHDCTVSLQGNCKACVTSGYSDILQTDCTLSLPNNCTNNLTDDCTSSCPSKCLTGLQNDSTVICSNICESLTAHIAGSGVMSNDCIVSLPNNCTTNFLNDDMTTGSYLNICDSLTAHNNLPEVGQNDCTVSMPDNCTTSLQNDCMTSCSNICDNLTAHNTGSEVKQNGCPVSLPNNCTTSLPNDCTPRCSNICDSSTAHNPGSEVNQNTPICHCCEDSVVGGKRKEVHTERQGDSRPSTPQPRVCMVGLHCCGDLTPTMVKCFKDLDCIRSLCCVSCCYHRMKCDESSGQFKNFPLSTCVKDIISKVPGWNPGLYGMRLAAQETRARWRGQTNDDHDFHVRNVAYRGTLEVCFEKGKFSLKKSSRKLAHQRDFKDFTVYIEAVSKHIHVPDSEEEQEYLRNFKEEMESLYSEYQKYFCYIEPVTALQVLLQPVIETVIYLDRQMYLLEYGHHCEIIPIFDEFISPRNLALVAVK